MDQLALIKLDAEYLSCQSKGEDPAQIITYRTGLKCQSISFSFIRADNERNIGQGAICYCVEHNNGAEFGRWERTEA